MGSPFAWYDLTTTTDDADNVRTFYSDLLGWTIAPADGSGPYLGWIMDGEQPWAAIVEADTAATGRWVPYVQVEDLDKAVEQATALGATVVAGKTDGPAGTAVTISDPGGAVLALWTPYPGKP
ncbi:VOC family protein [Actinomadura rudentiformis]|uniref:VOC domain-containing protein n=1 Tax=Actinomadura rudentiformis TaxID=359158 RepID=A0A6H9YL91_9ACTN|nr:VOC family protein [Actinomadura rudentiformis]KAB2340130.1 hypothetical protein F8566_45490 [Actinomadura rudentiformis]